MKHLTVEEWLIVILFILSIVFIMFASKWSLSQGELFEREMVSYQGGQLEEVMEDEE